jgi:hypothetical protein
LLKALIIQYFRQENRDHAEYRLQRDESVVNEFSQFLHPPPLSSGDYNSPTLIRSRIRLK